MNPLTFRSPKESPLLVVPQDNRPLGLVASDPTVPASLEQSRQGSRDSWLAWGWTDPALWKEAVARTLEGVSPPVAQEPGDTQLVEELRLHFQ